ncbi:MAG: peptidase M56 BlaR1 [Acetatifactor sp.]|nr:peptidase M56 BlaR1 [Acetatifactor sp.]
MLGETFYWIFNMSITAAVTGLVVLLIRTVRKIPRRVIYFLWIIPFLRMAIPLGLNSPYSFMSLISRFTTRTVTVFMTADDIGLSMTNCVMAADSYFPVTYKVNLLERLFSASSIVWIIGLLAAAAALAILYFSGIREMKDSVHLRENIYLSEKVQSPAVYGIVRPRIILPVSYAEKDIDYILMHERMHIRRADNLWRILAFIITAVHWFNPFAWLFLKLFLADTELACDECVISKCSPEQRKAYALSLLECKKSADAFASAFGGAKIRTRIENILSFQKMTWISAAGFTAFAIAIAVVLLTNAG